MNCHFGSDTIFDSSRTFSTFLIFGFSVFSQCIPRLIASETRIVKRDDRQDIRNWRDQYYGPLFSSWLLVLRVAEPKEKLSFLARTITRKMHLEKRNYQNAVKALSSADFSPLFARRRSKKKRKLDDSPKLCFVFDITAAGRCEKDSVYLGASRKPKIA